MNFNPTSTATKTLDRTEPCHVYSDHWNCRSVLLLAITFYWALSQHLEDIGLGHINGLYLMLLWFAVKRCEVITSQIFAALWGFLRSFSPFSSQWAWFVKTLYDSTDAFAWHVTNIAFYNLKVAMQLQSKGSSHDWIRWKYANIPNFLWFKVVPRVCKKNILILKYMNYLHRPSTVTRVSSHSHTLPYHIIRHVNWRQDRSTEREVAGRFQQRLMNFFCHKSPIIRYWTSFWCQNIE